MNCTYSFLEDYIEEIYKTAGIYTPDQLGIEAISARLNISVIFAPMQSMQSGNTIVIDSRLSDAEKWQDFCHEFGHVRWHGVNQRVMSKPYRDYQEWKAESFALHACVPSFMLREMELPRHSRDVIRMIQEVFGVDFDFAKKRLALWHQKIEGYLIQQRVTREMLRWRNM